MKKSWVISSVFSLGFILLTWLLSYDYHLGWLSEISFYLHLIPWGIGFSGGSYWTSIFYYVGLWVALTAVFKMIYIVYRSLKQTS